MQNKKIKTIGIFNNQASSAPIRSLTFYKEIIEIKLIHDLIIILSNPQNSSSLFRYILQLLGLLVHPIFGDILTFPWKRNQSESK